MGEASRRKRAGIDTAQGRAAFLALLHEMLAQEPADSDVTGITYFPAGGKDAPVFISAAAARRRMGRKPDA